MNRRTVAIAAAALLGGLLLFRVAQAVRDRMAPAQNELQPAAVRVAPATSRTLTRTATFSGVVRPYNEVDVFARVPGRVATVYVDVGDRVRAGQALAVLEHRELSFQEQAAAAARDQAAANADTARAQFERFEALRQSAAVAPAEYERVATAHRLAQAGLSAAEAQLGLAREALQNATLSAPIAGTVTRRMVDAGQQVNMQMPPFQIQDVRALKVLGSVAAEDAARLRVDAPATVRVDELPEVAFAGRVRTLSPTLDPHTRRAAVEIALDNKDGRLLPNMFANVTIEVDRRSDVLAVPRAALLNDARGTTLYVVDGGRATAVVPVLGLDDGEWVEVREGLVAGAQVVVAGQTDLSDGRAVTIATE